MTEPTVPATTSIGHVHLKVADLERAVRFYCDVMGFEPDPAGANGPLLLTTS